MPEILTEEIPTEDEYRLAVAIAMARINATTAGLVDLRTQLTATVARLAAIVQKATAARVDIPAEEWESATADGRRLAREASRQVEVLNAERVRLFAILVAAFRRAFEAGRLPTCASE